MEQQHLKDKLYTYIYTWKKDNIGEGSQDSQRPNPSVWED